MTEKKYNNYDLEERTMNYAKMLEFLLRNYPKL
jgi:hypothetical protein